MHNDKLQWNLEKIDLNKKLKKMEKYNEETKIKCEDLNRTATEHDSIKRSLKEKNKNLQK